MLSLLLGMKRQWVAGPNFACGDSVHMDLAERWTTPRDEVAPEMPRALMEEENEVD